MNSAGCKRILPNSNQYSAPKLENVENKDFSKRKDDTIQLKPQKVKITLRAGDEVTVPIHYRRAQDYPMDLYYLMDLSCTMNKYKKILGVVGKELADTLQKVTSNFRIGFGSFVDKPIMPFSAFSTE